MPGEHHLAKGGKQSAIGTVMIGKDAAILIETLNRIEKTLELGSTHHIRRLIAGLLVYLGQRRAAQSVFALAKIDQDEIGVTGVGAHARS